MIFQRKRLRRARFRDAWFFLNDTFTESGRRVSSYQFPFQDQPKAQDLGKQGQQIAIHGLVIGANYRLDAERLIKACEDKESGELFHPYYGKRKVFCKTVRVSENSIEGGVVYFAMTFIETVETSGIGFGLQNISLLGMILGNDAIKKAGEFLNDATNAANRGVEYLDEFNDSILMVTEVTEQTFSPLLHAKDSIANFRDSLLTLRSATANIYTSGVLGVGKAVVDLWAVLSGQSFTTTDPYNWTRFFPSDRYNGVPVRPIIVLGQQAFIVGCQTSHILSKYQTLSDLEKRAQLQALKSNVDKTITNAEGHPELYGTLKHIQAICNNELFNQSTTWNPEAPLIPQLNLTSKPKKCLILEAMANGGLSKIPELMNLYQYSHTCFPDG